MEEKLRFLANNEDADLLSAPIVIEVYEPMMQFLSTFYRKLNK